MKGVDFSSIEPSSELINLLIYVSKQYKGTSTKPIENIADLLANWEYKNDSLIIYEKCLELIKRENKPRVKTRLEIKIEKMK